MKIRRLEVEGFRGAKTPLGIPLGEKSLCLLGENGMGKSTLVDALELWSSGDLAAFHRHGCGLEAAVHVDVDAAVVSCQPTGLPVLTRTLRGSTVSELVPAGPVPASAIPPPPLPILRHRTMAEFMDCSHGEKRRALLELFGLGDLETFRAAVGKAKNDAVRAARNSGADTTRERAALSVQLAGEDLLQRAEALRTVAGLPTPITASDELLRYEVEEAPSGTPDRLGLISELARAAAAVRPESIDEWAAATTDHRAAESAALRSLLELGTQVIESTQTERCPLCLATVDHDSLLAEIARRSADLSEAASSFKHGLQAINGYDAALSSLIDVARECEAASPPEGWKAVDLSEWTRSLVERHSEVAAAIAERKAVPQRELGLGNEALAGLRDEAEAAAGDSGRHAALAALVALREAARRVEAAVDREREARGLQRHLERLDEITTAKVRTAIETAVAALGTTAADYYSRLMPGSVYSDVRLEYDDSYRGGVEFALTYDGRHEVSPPQRLVSESQLNALGLAFFLARHKQQPSAWRTLVLDDVVNSFDAEHRSGLARLLRDEFGEWQVILLTHDRVFNDVASRVLKGAGWRFGEIVAWTTAGGPVLADGDPRDRLKARLDGGAAASEVAGLARVALEQGLSRPLARLELDIRYDAHARHTAFDYIRALRNGLKNSGVEASVFPVIDRMEADSYVTNLGAHDRPPDPAVTRNDLYQLIGDLGELDEAFRCDSCGKFVWSSEQNHHFSCGCAANLAV